jgi:hypothetical protein
MRKGRNVTVWGRVRCESIHAFAANSPSPSHGACPRPTPSPSRFARHLSPTFVGARKGARRATAFPRPLQGERWPGPRVRPLAGPRTGSTGSERGWLARRAPANPTRHPGLAPSRSGRRQDRGPFRDLAAIISSRSAPCRRLILNSGAFLPLRGMGPGLSRLASLGLENRDDAAEARHPP